MSGRGTTAPGAGPPAGHGEPLADRVVLVLGLGRSGTAAAHALLDAGADVRVVDEAPGDGGRHGGTGADRREAALALDARGGLVRLDTSFDRVGLLDGIELVVTSPGVPPRAGVLTAATQRGVPVWSEVELAWQLADGRARIVGVTGTNGKTTTTELIGRVLDVPVGGNIGTPLVTLLGAAAPPPLVAAELSSFQLHHTHSLRTDVGVLLNVADDHLDWHGSRAAYRRDKARIWARQRTRGAVGPGGCDWAVVGVDDRGARDAMADAPPPAGVIGVTSGPPRPGEVGVDDGWVVARVDVHAADASGRAPTDVAPVRIVRVDDLALRGPHNLTNVCAAAAAAIAAGADPTRLARPLAAQRAGAHRLATVAERAGVTWVDDSKATNPRAAAAAIASFRSVVWIAGGLAKGVDLSTLDPLLRERARAVVTIGTDGPVIARRAQALGLPTIEAGVLDEAVRRAAEVARPGDTVLLAPACASMDQFRDYAERGERFAAAVSRLTGTPAPDPHPQAAQEAPADGHR